MAASMGVSVAAVGQTTTVYAVSVAVLVDGNYTRDKDDNLIYSPRLEEEMKKINQQLFQNLN